MGKILKALGMLFLIYTLGLFLSLCFEFLRMTGRVRIRYPANIRGRGSGMIVFSNHPSLMDPVLVPVALFAPRWFAKPFKVMPWSVADKKNYIDKWYYFFLRLARVVPVRTNSDGERSDFLALRKMFRAVRSGDNLIIYPEGTRTAKTKKRYEIAGGKQLGYFRPGIEFLLRHSSSEFLPVWIEGTEKVMPVGSWFPAFWRSPIAIVIGEPFTNEGDAVPKDPDERRRFLEEKLIDLAEM